MLIAVFTPLPIALLILLLAAIVTLPWIFMWTTMAASCVPMMNGMGEMMGPGMR